MRIEVRPHIIEPATVFDPIDGKNQRLNVTTEEGRTFAISEVLGGLVVRAEGDGKLSVQPISSSEVVLRNNERKTDS